MSDKLVFPNVTVASAQTGIPIELFEAAQLIPGVPLGNEGFSDNGRIYWTKLQPWFEEHRSDIEALAATSPQEWQQRKVRAVALYEEFELKKSQGKYIEREKVKQLLRTISAAQCSLFNSKFRQELAIKINGKSVPETVAEIDKALTEVFGIMQKELDLWQ